MNYEKIYMELINRARNRVYDGYVEKHHILPKCLGGSDEPDNLIKLLPEEHYLSHLLLCKIYPGNQKLLYAAINMTTGSMINNGKRNNKLYGWLRRRYSESMSGDNNPNRKNPEIQKQAGLKRTGQKRTEETKQRMSASQKGRTFSDDTKKRMSESANNRPPISEETRHKLSIRSKGRTGPWASKKVPSEIVQKRAEQLRGRKDSEEARLKKSMAAKIREEKKRLNKQKESCVL